MDLSLILIIAGGALALLLLLRAFKKKPEETVDDSVSDPTPEPISTPAPAVRTNATRKPLKTRRGATYNYAYTGRDGRDYYSRNGGVDVVDILILWWVLDSFSQDAYTADVPAFVPDESYQEQAAAYDVTADGVTEEETDVSGDVVEDDSSDDDVTPSTETPADDDTLRSTPAPTPEPSPAPSSCSSSDDSTRSSCSSSSCSSGSSCGSSCGGGD